VIRKMKHTVHIAPRKHPKEKTLKSVAAILAILDYGNGLFCLNDFQGGSTTAFVSKEG